MKLGRVAVLADFNGGQHHFTSDTREQIINHLAVIHFDHSRLENGKCVT